MFDKDRDHIHAQPNNKGIALYYTVLYIDILENDSGLQQQGSYSI